MTNTVTSKAHIFTQNTRVIKEIYKQSFEHRMGPIF